MCNLSHIRSEEASDFKRVVVAALIYLLNASTYHLARITLRLLEQRECCCPLASLRMAAAASTTTTTTAAAAAATAKAVEQRIIGDSGDAATATQALPRI